MQELIIHYGLIIVSLAIIVAAMLVVLSEKMIIQAVLLSVISIFSTLWYALVNSPDVALTEAAVNAAIGTIFMFVTFQKVEENSLEANKLMTLLILLIAIFAFIGAFNILKVLDFGSILSASNLNLGLYYIQHTYHDIGINSMVAAILASYRGFDTLCETMVVFIAGIAVTIITSIQFEEKNE
ncbi:hydrogenase subunit MbhD domain-containing protein [Rickettsiales endosymbiont of Stachyamoeba lipophora]|uniref:hydrogenase subunit MbhD domain-containing protein n=1 Tax=Rickettsiales endosymbiont of Stachyamoeba lipophora TaxID=2486578 RepID=UPI000F650CA8|nr:hydrogenase subunit MbhD domain-containing protein [Rickettsiales endosymbiont of Stachyamoeba lipophora]AZL15789.1 DUF4040 domain-containing protein [Rickettsiales endosymbiont of Stachyamoeba lipophora]